MTDRDIERLAAELRGWAERPTALSASKASTRVLADLPSRHRRPVWRLAPGSAALAASALAVVVLIGALLIGIARVRRHDGPVASPPAPAAETSRPMIVHQLSSGTKLYIVMQPSSADSEC